MYALAFSHRISGGPRRWCAVLLAWACLALLGGCQTDLVSNQSEADVNSMVSALLVQGIEAEKVTRDAGKTWVLAVEKDETVRALLVLKAAGLPPERFVSLGDMFKKEGLISTPFEERVRFVHGVSQELSDTLSHIDGVVTAKVHIVLPTNDPMATKVTPSSASVFVKHRPEANMSNIVPSIKTMVSRAVEGLAYDNVNVTLVPASDLVLPARVAGGGWVWGAAAGFVVLLLAGGAAVVVLRPQWLPPGLQKLRKTAVA